MKKKCILVLVALILSVSAVLAQQNITYNQYGNTIVPLNTAGSFLSRGGKISLIGRQQWVGIDGAPKAYRLSAVLPEFGPGISVGINIRHETMAVEQLSEVVVFAGKSIQISGADHLGVSIGFGTSYYRGNFSRVDDHDPAFNNDIREGDGLVSLSAMYYRPGVFYAGVSITKLSFSKLGLTTIDSQTDFRNQYYLTAGALFPLGDDFSLKPAALLGYAKNMKMQADVSAMVFMKNVLGLGANVRTYGDLAGMLQFNISNVSFNYSYQFNTKNQPLGGGLGKTHEIGVNLNLGKGIAGLL